MFALVFHLLIVVCLLGALVSVVVNVTCFEGLEPAPIPTDPARVSVLVPARNEAHNIELCVHSLLAQDWPNLEVIVLDDRSEDGTGEILRAIDDPRLRVIEGEPLPSGWVGKNWACHQLSGQARGEWLFFTDADTEHAPGTVSAAVAHAVKHRADLLSAWPRLITVTLGEQLVIPMIVFVAMTFYPHVVAKFLQRWPHIAAWIPPRQLRGLGAANGQFLFFSRLSYDRIGGHLALKNHLVEDVAFGRAVAERMGDGMRLINCESLRFSTCRMYRSFEETWEGFTKNARAAFEDNVVAIIFLTGFLSVCFIWPFFALFLDPAPKGLVITAIFLIYLIRGILAVRFKTSWLSVLLHPIGLMVAFAIGINSGIRSSRGGVIWKGRRYTMSNVVS